MIRWRRCLGGKGNRENLSKIFWDVPFIEESHFIVGPLLIRIPSYVGDYDSYIERIEDYVSKNKLRFRKDNSIHYDVDEKFGEVVSGMRSFVIDIFDEIYVETIELHGDSIKNILDMDFKEASNFYDDIVVEEYFYRIPYLESLFLEDDAFQDVNEYLKDAKFAFEKEETKLDVERQRNQDEAYAQELAKLFNKNGNPDSKYFVSIDDWDGKKVILIEHNLISEDLKTALMLNAVKGSFKNETNYMLTNLRSTIKTIVDTNPTNREIVYVIVNPENKDLFLYVNYNGLDLFSEFNE